MATAGRINISLSAGTAQFVVDMEKANAKIREFGGAHAHTVSSVQATSAALRTLEGGITNNLRAAENFLAKTLNLGGVLKTAFPVVGAIALGGVLFELITKANEAYEGFVKLQQAPKRISQEFFGLAQPIRVANDELAVSNDRLENEIAKLQGKPQNGLKLALHETVLEADKLAESTNRAFEQVQKLLEQEQIGGLKALFTGNASTTGLTEQFKKFRESLTDLSISSNERIDKAPNDTARADIAKEASRNRIQLIRAETEELKKQLRAAQEVQDEYEHPKAKPVILATAGVAIRADNRPGPQDQEVTIRELKAQIDVLQGVLANASLSQSVAALKGKKDQLEAVVSNAKLDQPLKDYIAELDAKLRGAKAELTAALKGGDKLDDYLGAAVAKGLAEADKGITELNKRRAEARQKPLGLGSQVDITAGQIRVSLTQAQTKSAEEFNRKMKEAQEESIALADKIKLEDLRRSETLALMDQQIAEAGKLAAAEKQGAEAVFQAQERIRTARIEDPAIREKTAAVAQAEHTAEIAKTVTQLDRESEANKRLAAAVLGGVQAQRAAELENIRASGAAPDQIAAEVRARQAQYRLEDAAQLKGLSASDGARAYFQEMIDNAQSAAAQVKEVLGSAFEGLNDTVSRLISGQKVNWGSFFQGISAQIAKMGLQNAEAGLAKQLGGVLSGGGSAGDRPWSEKGPAGILGGIFGLGGAGKRDGSSAGTALYVQMAAADSASAGPTLQGLFGSRGGAAGDGDNGAGATGLQALFGGLGGGSSDQAGGLFGSLFGGAENGAAGGGAGVASTILGLFGGFRAGGGDVDPGKAYVVGENGPELFTPPSGGSITPNHKLGGSFFSYTIDARGTDPVLTEHRVKGAIVAAHQSAIQNSVRVQQERQKRTPQR